MGTGDTNDRWKRGLRLPAEERREQLLDAAVAVIRREGFDGLTVEAAAAAAGVSRALAYNYFDGLDGLLSDLYDREFSAVYHRLGPALSSDGTFEQRIARKVSAYFDFIDERRSLLAQLWRNMNSAQLRADRQRRWDLWEGFVAAVLSDEFIVDDDIARSAARLLMSIDDRCVNLWYERKLPRDVAERMSVQFQLAGLQSFLQRRHDDHLDDSTPASASASAEPPASPIDPAAQVILDRVRTIIRYSGPDAVTIRRLADECDLRPADLYRYFSDKAAIADGVRAEFDREYEAALTRALRVGLDGLATRLTATICSLLERHLDAVAFAVRHGSPGTASPNGVLAAEWSSLFGDESYGHMASVTTDGIVYGAVARGELPSRRSIHDSLTALVSHAPRPRPQR